MNCIDNSILANQVLLTSSCRNSENQMILKTKGAFESAYLDLQKMTYKLHRQT